MSPRRSDREDRVAKVARADRAERQGAARVARRRSSRREEAQSLDEAPVGRGASFRCHHCRADVPAGEVELLSQIQRCRLVTNAEQ